LNSIRGPTELRGQFGVNIMDREEAIRLLKGGKEGIEEWDRRRKSGEDIPDLKRADLTGANLSRADVHGADLSGANLSGAILIDADLSDANLHGANLSGANGTGVRLYAADIGLANAREANLSGAKLTEAELSNANLIEANLTGAIFSDSNLMGADLSHANVGAAFFFRANLTSAKLFRADLSGANLSGAVFKSTELSGMTLSDAVCGITSFGDVDLSEVDGLDSVKHEAPSTVGIDTLFRSHGKIPEAFLRGCGVPEYIIENQKALIGSLEPIQFYSCFISYSTKDEEFAKRLHSRMIQEKLRVWYAPEEMRAGCEHDVQIDEAIRVYDKLLLVVSEASMTSGWVRREIRKARRTEGPNKPRKLFPIRLVSVDTIKAWEPIDPRTGEDLAEELLRFHIPDFSNWKDHDAFEAAFTKLLRDLKAEAPPTPAT
jgi:hypothetical protein